jgi:hypothetical protein
MALTFQKACIISNTSVTISDLWYVTAQMNIQQLMKLILFKGTVILEQYTPKKQKLCQIKI